MKKATHTQRRTVQNLWGLMKPRKPAVQHSAAARHARKHQRGFGARKIERKEGVVAKVLRTLKLKN